MAVIITKKFWNDTEFKDIAKIVFTSPNFTSPADAGTRSHMPPGGKYIGTWFEAVDFMYRKFVNQDYANFPAEMESFFGKLYVDGTFDYENDTTVSVKHMYGTDYNFQTTSGTATYPSVIYTDKDNYGVVSGFTSTGTVDDPILGTVATADITFNSVVGSGIVNEWLISTVSGSVDGAVASGLGVGDTNPVNCYFSASVSGTANDYEKTELVGTVSGTLTGIGYGSGNLSADVIGTISGTLYGELDTTYSDVSGTVSGTLSGPEFGTIMGTLSGTVNGSLIAPVELMFHQYSDATISGGQTVPKSRRHYGENSVIFAVTFGEAYSCRLTAWDDDTHSTTNNKVLDEEHYRVDAVAYRSNVEDTPHLPALRKTNSLVFPPTYDLALKGNDSYYGDFDLIFAIESDEFGEYLAFTPRLVNMDNSFTAGGYDFITTLHYQYT